MSMTRRAALLATATGLAASMSMPAGAPAQKHADQRHPDIVGVKVTARGGDIFDFDVTVSSPYDTAARYADAFRVLAPDGKVLGERILLHDHADEQPFTRDLHGVRIPPGIARVTVQGRDMKHGYGGGTKEAVLPGR